MTTPRNSIAYAGAHYGKSLFWYMSELLVGFYLAEIYGLSPAVIGTLLFAFLVWDAITDPLLALLFLRRRIGTRAMLDIQAFGAILSTVAFALVFFRPSTDSVVLTVYALFAGVFFRTAYTVYDVPQNALMHRLADTARDRLFFATLRTAFSAIATLTVSLSSALILSGDSVTTQAQWFTVTGVLFGVVAMSSAAILRRSAFRSSDSVPIGQPHRVRQTWLTITDPATIRLLVASFVLSIGWPLFGKLTPFFAKYVLDQPKATGTMFAAMAIGAFASQPVWLRMGHRIGRRRLGQILVLCATLACLSFWVHANNSALWTSVIVAVISACTSGASTLLWTILADRMSDARMADANDLFAFGGFTFASKIGLGLSGLALGLVLSQAGYTAGAGLGTVGQSWVIATMAAFPAMCVGVALHIARPGKHVS